MPSSTIVSSFSPHTVSFSSPLHFFFPTQSQSFSIFFGGGPHVMSRYAKLYKIGRLPTPILFVISHSISRIAEILNFRIWDSDFFWGGSATLCLPAELHYCVLSHTPSNFFPLIHMIHWASQSFFVWESLVPIFFIVSPTVLLTQILCEDV